MSPLWKDKNKTENKLIKPSPKHKNHISGLAQDPLDFCLWKFPNKSKQIACVPFVKGISLFISRRVRGSMSLEAGILIPLFLLFVLNLTSVIEMLRLHGNVQLALWNTGNEISVYGSLLSGEEAVVNLLSGVYVNGKLQKYLGEDYLNNSPLANGKKSLYLTGGRVLEGDYLELTAAYEVSPACNIAELFSFYMANRYYGHLWSGYELPEEGEIFVFVAENGEVYHTERSCSYLELSVMQKGLEDAKECKNSYGKSYKACERCFQENAEVETVYITEDGQRYHSSVDCVGLKRTVFSVPLSQVEDMPVCHRCGL